VVGSTKSSICDRRREGEEDDDDERKEDETAALCGLRRLWLVVNGWQSDIRKVAWTAMPRKIAEGRAMMVGFGVRSVPLCLEFYADAQSRGAEKKDRPIDAIARTEHDVVFFGASVPAPQCLDRIIEWLYQLRSQNFAQSIMRSLALPPAQCPIVASLAAQRYDS